MKEKRPSLRKLLGRSLLGDFRISCRVLQSSDPLARVADFVSHCMFEGEERNEEERGGADAPCTSLHAGHDEKHSGSLVLSVQHTQSHDPVPPWYRNPAKKDMRSFRFADSW